MRMINTRARTNGQPVEETFGIAAFRSRQQVLKFEGALRREGIRGQVITTPRDVSVGCGLSIRFGLDDTRAVLLVYQKTRPSNLIGFYTVQRQMSGRPIVTPIAR